MIDFIDAIYRDLISHRMLNFYIFQTILYIFNKNVARINYYERILHSQ